MVLAQTSGAPFSLLSIDLARNFAFDVAPTVTFTGTLAGGGTVSQTFTVTTPLGTSAFQTFQFTGFTNVTQVTWDQPVFPPPPGQGLHQFTNVVLSTAPAPSGLTLGSIAALGGMLLVWRLRRPGRQYAPA